ARCPDYNWRTGPTEPPRDGFASLTRFARLLLLGRTPFLIETRRLAPLAQDALDLGHVLVADPFAAAGAPLPAVEPEFPHGTRPLQVAPAHVAALLAVREAPLPGELGGAQVAPAAGPRVDVGPLDLGAHRDFFPSRKRRTKSARSAGSGISQRSSSPLAGC